MKPLYLACALFVSAANAGTLTLQDGQNSGGNNVTISGTRRLTLTQGSTAPEVFSVFDITRGTEIRQVPRLAVTAPDGATLTSGHAPLDFGSLDLSDVKTLTLALRNDGNKDLTGIAFTIDGPDADAFAITPSTDTLAPQTSDTASITWVVRKTGPLTATLHITSNDPDHSPFDIALTATGTDEPTKLEITEDGNSTVLNTDSSVDFGTVTIGSQTEKTFHVRNLSSAPVRLNGSSVYQPYDYNWWGPYYLIRLDAPGFYLTATTPSIMAPGATLDFKLRFQPTNTGTTSRTVALYATRGTESVSQTFTVTGIGAPYVPMPLELGGLYYRMGEDRSPLSMPLGARLTIMPATPPYPLSATWPRWSPTLSTPTLVAYGDAGYPFLGSPGGASSAAATGSTQASFFTKGARYSTWSVQLPASDNIGMELWTRPASLADNQCIAFVGDAGPDAGFGLYINGGRIEGRVGAARLLSDPIALSDWHHVSLIVQNGQATLRVDGVIVGEVVTVTLPTVVKSLGVGGITTVTDNVVSGSDAFTGAVDDLRLFEVPPGGFLPDSQLLANAKPHAGVSQSAINFGTLMAGSTPTSNVDLLNHGPGWLAVKAEIVGPDAADFGLSPLASPTVIGYDQPPSNFFVTIGISIYQLIGFPPSPTLPHSLGPSTRETLTVRMNASTVGPHSATLRITTNDVDHPTIDIPLTANLVSAQPKLAFDPAWIDFGTVLTNSSGDNVVTIHNTGTQPLTLTTSFAGPNADDFALTSAISSVAANDSGTLPVHFQPRGPGGSIASLHLLSNDPDHPVIDIPLYGVGQTPAPRLTVNYNSVLGALPTTPLDFGSVLEGGHTADRYLQLINVGTADLTNLVLTFEGPNAADFALTDPVPDTLVRSGYGTYYANTILRFTPHGDGPRNAVVRITSNDPNANPLLINLTGTGLPAAPTLRVTDSSFPRFGTGVIGGDARTTTFHVINEGTLPLTDLTASFIGPEAAEFSAAVPNNIAVNATGEITLAFKPSAIGPRSATLRLASTVAGTHLDLTVGGTGAYGPKANLSVQPVANWVGTALLQLPNGNVLMAGYTELLGLRTYRLREIFPDGAESLRFAATALTLPGQIAPVPGQVSGPVTALALQADGSVLYTGAGVHRIPANWSTDDPTFHPPTGDFQGHAIVALPDGKILVGGEGSLGGRARLIRLNADGSLDTTFALPEPDAVVNAFALQADGKVIVGGEFTNIDPAPAPFTGIVFVAGPGRTDGLCRLNADGTLDYTFHNSPFEKVTALATRDGYVAVGGVQQQIAFWMTNYAGSNYLSLAGNGPTSGTSTFDQPMAALLGHDGTVIAARNCSKIPTAVAVQPGARMLVAPGDEHSYDISQRPTVSLVQAGDRPTEWYGIKAESDTLPQPYSWFNARTQELDGDVNALLAQDDGKVLVAGSLTMACVVEVNMPIYQVGVPLPIEGYSLTITAPVPAETPVKGFVQLDVDGFYNQPLPSPALDSQPLSDGLSSVDFGSVGSTTTRSLDWAFMTNADSVRAEVVGLDSDAFTVSTVVLPQLPEGLDWSSNAASTIVLTALRPSPSTPWFLNSEIQITATPTHLGTANARLRLIPQIADANGNLTDDLSNPFEIALVANGVPALSPNIIPTDSITKTQLTVGQELSFTATLGETDRHGISLANTGTTDALIPAGNIDGPDAADFQLTVPSAGALKAGASLSATIVFKPGTVGTKTATLHLSTPGLSGFPFDIHLTGNARAVPVIASVTPDQLVAKGSPTTLTLTLNEHSGPAAFQWSKDGRVIPNATGSTFAIPVTDFANVGTYRVKLTHSQGSELSDPIRLVVYDPLPTVTTLKSGSLFLLHCNAKGPGKLSYEWYHGDTLIPRAQRAVFFISKVSPADAGSYHCRVTMGNGAADTGLAVLNVLTVPTVQPFTPTTWWLNTPVEISLSADLPASDWIAAGLPPGVKLNARSGVLSGAPTAPGTYNVSIRAVNLAGAGPALTQAITVPAADPLLPGAYERSIERYEPITEGLGGFVRIVIASNGRFTGKVQLGTQGLRRGNYGYLRESAFAGAIQSSGQGGISDPVPLPGIPGLSCSIYCTPLIESSQVMVCGFDLWKDGGVISEIETYKTLRKTPPEMMGQVKTTNWRHQISRDARMSWVARVPGYKQSIVVLTGTNSIVERQKDDPAIIHFFALHGSPDGARSLLGLGLAQGGPMGIYTGLDWGSGFADFPAATLHTDPFYFGSGDP